MTAHDKYCQWPRLPCECDDFAAARAEARADERKQCEKEVAATAKWCREDERETIASLLEDYGYGDAAQIARNGGRDE